MKKFISYLLVVVLCLSCLAACSKSQNGGDQPSATSTPTPAASGEDAEALAEAKDYLFAMYKDKQGTCTSDFERVAVLNMSGSKFTVTWSANDTANVKIVPGDKFTTIDINEKTTKDVDFVLTATITDENGNSVTQTFTHSIPAYKETSWAEYVAAKKDAPVICTGIVTGIMSKSNGNSYNCLYFQDADGGYYAYNLSADPIADGIKVGMTVKVSGTKDTYSGTYEIMNGKVEIVDSSIKTVAPADYTALYTKAANLKDAALCEKQSLLVTLKNVEITGQDVASGYYKFKLGDKESYIRVSSSVCPIVKEKDKFIAGHTDHNGWIANATGILCLYDGAFYLTPATTDAFEYLSLPVKSDAEMVEFEAAKIKFDSSYTDPVSIALNSVGKTYKDVKLTWYTSNAALATIANDTLKFTIPEQPEVVTISVELKAGSASKALQFKITLAQAPDDMCTGEALAQAAALENGKSLVGKQVLRGKITKIVTAYSSQYNNITVDMDVNGQTVQCYRLAGGNGLKVGDSITVTGTLTKYNDIIEFAAGATYSKNLPLEDAKQLLVVEKAYALESGKSLNGTQVLCGDIEKIVTPYDASYDNITVDISVGGKTIQAYRLKGGKDLKVGDKITVTGTLKNYNGTIEFDKGCTYERGSAIAATKSQLLINEAYELESGKAMTGLKELHGTVASIVTAYDASYNNITINLQVGDKLIQCYRMVGGSNLQVGDKIVVTGTIKNYNGTIEFDKGCTYVPDLDK